MSYGTPVTILQWTDTAQRNPIKWVVTAYLNNTSVDSTTAYNEADMEKAFTNYREQARLHKTYDQVKVTQAPIVVPSTQGSD